MGLLWQAGCLQMCLAYGVTLYRCTAIANGFETHVSRLKRGSGLRMGQLPGIKSLGQLPGIKSLISGRFLPSRNTLPMLQAVKPGVFVAVDASCILPCLLVSYGR